MENEHRAGQVGEAMQTLPVFSTERANRPLIARQCEDHEDGQSPKAEPNKRLRKTPQQALGPALIQKMAGKMEQTVNACGHTDHAAMAVQRTHDAGTRKQDAQR